MPLLIQFKSVRRLEQQAGTQALGLSVFDNGNAVPGIVKNSLTYCLSCERDFFTGSNASIVSKRRDFIEPCHLKSVSH